VTGELTNERSQQFIGRVLEKSSDTPTPHMASPTTALGVKVTDNGVMACNPLDLRSFLQSRGITASVATIESGPTVVSKSCRTSKRSKTQVTKSTSRLDYELVVSEAAAITGYQIDSFLAGSWHYGLIGTKIVFSFPLTAKNWDLFKDHYFEMPPLDTCLLCYFGLIIQSCRV